MLAAMDAAPPHARETPDGTAGPGTPSAAGSAAGVAGALVALLRPLHWVKNLVVLTPLLFAGRLTDPPSLRLGLEAFALFCLLASGVYAFNDIRDRRSDACHPTKRRRPLACGALPVWAAALLGALLLAAALAWAHDLARRTPPLVSGTLLTDGLATLDVFGWVLAYLALNAAYTLGLKRLPVVDVVTLAAGFGLRAFAGAAVLQLQPSRWLVICVFGLALFLAVGKRHLELSRADTDAARSRPMWKAYGPDRLPRALTLLALANIVAYAWYALSPATVAKVGSHGLLATWPLVAFGVWRLRGLLLDPHPERSATAATGGDPVELVLRDRPSLAVAALWLAACLTVVYRPW